ncbi:sensor histidine kinase [Bradyrhizobium sp.]|uniref:sensor histidine kinase n=1 Tax=Bradyrhizobium sp. TaxID=376 RepID=UPI003C36DBE0
MPLLLSVLGVGLVTAPLLLLQQTIAADLVPIAYLIPVIFAATTWGIWPATLASIASMVAADFFFFPPIYSLQVEDPQDAVDLLLFLVVALVSGNLASRLRRETDTLRQREAEIHQLYDFSRRLAACFTISDLVAAIQKYLSRALGTHAVFFVATADGHFEPPQCGQPPGAVVEHVAAMGAAVGLAARLVVDQRTREAWLLRAVCSETAVHGVIAINIGAGTAEALSIRMSRAEAVLDEVSLTLQRLDIGKAMEDARLHLQAELLRDAFHGTISHELCSPLAAIQGSATVLSSVPMIHDNTQARSLVDAILEEAAELDGYIKNLLNATKVTAGGLRPQPDWTDPRDIIDAAIRRAARRLAAHKIEMTFDEYLPLVRVDSGLIEQACGQLLQNAAKYSPSGSAITIKARAEQQRLIISVSDHGVGITPDEQQQLGRRSFRSKRHQATIPGSGLGFWIASTFVRANGGTIAISSPGPGLGTTASISLPAFRPTTTDLMAIEND